MEPVIGLVVPYGPARIVGMIWWIAVLLPLAGRLAWLLVPGGASMPWWQTTAVALAGSFLSGAAGYLWLDKDLHEGLVQRSGFLASVVGAVAIVSVANLSRRISSGSASPTSSG